MEQTLVTNAKICILVVAIALSALVAACSSELRPVRLTPEGQDFLSAIGEALPGYKVTFASPRSGSDNNQDIWLINADGTGERNLTQSDSGGYDIYPEWSPDGEYVYYTSNKYGGEALELYRVNTSGTPKPERLTSLGKEVRSLSISPENKHIAMGVMSTAVELGASLRPYSADLYILELSKLEARQRAGELITLDDMNLILSEPISQHIWHEQPDWQPGKRDEQSKILYVRTQDYDNDWIMKDEIWSVNLDGSNNQLVVEEASMPRWTADGNSFVTHGFTHVDMTTGVSSRLNIHGLSSDAGAAVLSPDGQFVVFETDDRNRQAGVARVVLSEGDGSVYHVLSERPAYEPRWSPVPVPDL